MQYTNEDTQIINREIIRMLKVRIIELSQFQCRAQVLLISSENHKKNGCRLLKEY